MKKTKPPSHRRKYPWEQWFKSLQKRGTLLINHKDFDCQVHGMAQQIRNAAGRIGLRVSLNLNEQHINVTLVESISAYTTQER